MITHGQRIYDLYTQRMWVKHGYIVIEWQYLDDKIKDSFEYAAQNFLEEELAA